MPTLKKLTGLDPDRVSAAREEIRALNIPHLARELLQPTIDAAVGATLLTDSLDKLGERGVEHSKLASKLRNDPNVWPAWAELRAARDLSEFLEDDAEIQLEAGRARGKHSDFRFSRQGGPIFRFLPTEGSSSISVEFKAIGLSDDEALFCRRARPTLEALKPPRGFVTAHTQLDFDKEGVWMDDAAREHGEREAIRLANQLPAHTQGLSGAVVVAHGSEESYVRRIRNRLREAFAQLPEGDECWIAIHWSNGAPAEAVPTALETLDPPSNLVGLLLVGSAVAFPYPDIHNFASWLSIDRDASGERRFHSSVDNELASLVHGRIDRSAGVRASIVRTGMGTRTLDMLVRDGSRRILPFILLIDPDPDPTAHVTVPIPRQSSATARSHDSRT